jgi:hypothetical protein
MVRRSTLGLICLGIGITLGSALFLGGCSIASHYWPVFAVVPALLGLMAQYGIVTTIDPGSEPGWIGTNGWVFLLMLCLASIFGLPLVLVHVNSLPGSSVAMFMVGAGLVVAGYCAALYLGQPDSE